MIGTMQEFQPGTEPILAFLKRQDAYLHTNAVAEEKPSLVHVSTIRHWTLDQLEFWVDL